MKTNTEGAFEGVVRGLSGEGLGIVEHPDGRVVFVPGVWPGDRAKFRVLRFEKRYGFGELEQLLENSPDRVAVPCSYQGHVIGKCGGCPWMIGSYASQIKHKEHRVRHALDRAKLLSDPSLFKTIIGSEPLGYRNRAQFKTDGARLGFVSEGSREMVDIEDCIALNAPMRESLTGLRAQLPNPEWRPAENFPWNFIDLDDACESGTKPVLNRRRPFRQGNTAQNVRMQNWLRAKLAAWNVADGVALELFSGAGNFTEILAEKGQFRRIHAFEVGNDSVAALKARELTGVAVQEMDLFSPPAWRLVARAAKDAKILLLDPPRAGAKGIDRLVKDLPALERIWSISCDTATFVRDTAAMASVGWKLNEVQPIDLFPQTAHVELMAELVRA